MGDLKAIGSEKLTGQDKIKRIMEIATYGESSKNTDYHTSTNSFSKRAADGVLYAIVQEKDGYYVKSGLNESELDYVNGLANKRRNRYRSYSAALKRINLMLKPINEQYNSGHGDSLYEQAEEEKVVIKTPAPAAPPVPTGLSGMGMGDEDMDIDVDMEMGDEDMDVDVDMGGEEGFDQLEQTPTVKAIQKLTGKLGQRMREYEDEMDSDMIKYVLNSVISAVDLDELDDGDRDDIVSRLEPELEDEYGMGDEFDVDMEMGDEDMDVDMEANVVPAGPVPAGPVPVGPDAAGPEGMAAGFEDFGLEESLKKRVNKTLKKYYKESKFEKGRKLFNESSKKSYIKKQMALSNSKSIAEGVSETVEQELKAKEVLRKNKNIKFVDKTNNGTLIFEGKHIRMGVNKKGNIIR